MVIATQRVAGNIGRGRIGEDCGRVGGSGKIIEAGGNNRPGSGDQFLGTCPAAAVARHIIHFAMAAGSEPCVQIGFRRFDHGGTDSDFGQTELPAPFFDSGGKLPPILRFHGDYYDSAPPDHACR